MSTFTPVFPSPAATQSDASAALKRLADAGTTLSSELLHLPQPPQTLLDALKTEDKDQVEQETNLLLQRIDTYWRTSSASGQSRRTLFADHLADALHDEAVLKSHEGDLEPNATACLPLRAAVEGQSRENLPSASSLHVKFDEQTLVEIKGALVMSIEAGRTLLALPGTGMTEFATQHAMQETVALWLNDEVLRWAVLINADRRHQAAALAVAEDSELFIERFTAADVQLQAITANPYRFALRRQMDKQREDVRYLCSEVVDRDPTQHARRIEAAINLSGVVGPSTMLERREQALIERKVREDLPHWMKIATPEDRKEYAQRLRRYDQAREALSSVLNGAASADQYAEVSLRARLANDLGYDLEPGTITVSTQRTLPVTGESYTITRSLPKLALYGLHPDDQQDDSEFLTRTTISIDDIPADAAYPSLNPAYLARTINQLQLRANFGAYQRTAYAKASNQKLMRELLKTQIAELAYAARMQGHISVDDFGIIEAITGSTAGDTGVVLRVQQIRISGSDIPANILVFRKENSQGGLERLIMFAADAPRAQLFQGFHNETQLLHELVSWSAIHEMSDYLLQQLPVSRRPALSHTLEALRQKPHPEPDFIRLVSLDDYEAGLHSFVSQLISVTCSNHEIHTPGWYLKGQETERQKLVALEDAIAGAIGNYDGKAHTRVKDFEDYVHERASEKIAQLLNVPAGTVDPNRIVITSERETLTYTQLMRNGYDDSIGFLTPTADTMATFSGPEGIDLSTLTPASVAGSVRGKWLADGYAALIRSTLLDPSSTGYEYRRQASALITRLEMEAAALRSLLKGHIDASQYLWLEPAISHADRNDPALRTRYPVYPLQIHVDKPFIASRLDGVDQLVITDTNLIHVETVQGCFALLSTESRHSALLYTPNAPDGVEFRLFSSFVESLGHPGMIDYYKDRCRINARRTLSFFLNDMMQGNANKAPFIPKESIPDFAQVCFNRPVERKLRDVEETTTGRHDMLSNVIWNSVDIIASVLTLPFPPASFAVGVALSLRDSLKALQALTGESPDEAQALILASVLNIAGAAGDASVGLKGFGGLARKLAKDSRQAPLAAALKKPSALPIENELYPVRLQDELYLINTPNASGQASVYRSIGFDTVDTYPTGQYAVRDSAGIWQPLGQPSTTSVSTAPNGISAQRVVNVSLRDLPRVPEGHAMGVSLGSNGTCYIELNGLVYQVQYDASIRCWHIVDPENPFAFFGRQPVKLSEQGQWQLIERSALRGGGKDDAISFKPLQEDATGSEAMETRLAAYEMPKHLQPHISEILGIAPTDPMGMGLEDFFEVYYAQMRQRYASLRETLYRDAGVFFDQSPVLPPRPVIPAIDPSTTSASFLESLFDSSNGLVVSEAPKSIASKRFLQMHMPMLAEQRVEVLYIEHLFTDKHLAKLAKYRAKGQKIRAGSHEIKYHLKALNDGALDNLSREYDYYHLIKEAHRHGIEVRPLSSSVSYPVSGHPVASAIADSTAAHKMSSFFGHKVISGDVAAEPAKRWVALVDQKLATTYEKIPGIAELEAAISVHIDGVPAGRAMRIIRDTRRATDDVQPMPCDFRIEVADPTMTEPAVVASTSTAPGNPLPRTIGADAHAATANTSTGGIDFRWDEASGWQRVPAHEWIAQSPPTALQQSFADAAYEMPTESRQILHDLAYFRRRGLDEEYFFDEAELIPVREQFFELRDKLQRDARALTSDHLPARPVMPAVEPQPSTEAFIEQLYQQTDGMVIGEFHDSIASKKFIMDNMPLLARQNVKTLYMEHFLTDLHQVHLDRFTDTGHMSSTLLDDIRILDRGHLTDPAEVYTFEKLIIKAQQHGLEIRAIDCAASYHLKGVRQATATTRQQMMNYFASRTIRRHQAVMGTHKWVALVGNSHSNTFANTVPGLAELEGAIGLRLVDVPPGTSNGITLDAGENVRASLSTREEFLKGDFKVEIEVQRTPVSIRAPQPLPMEVRLSRPGMFLTEQEPGNLHFIIHRSRDNAIHRTPIQLNAAGKVYVDRPSWTTVHLQPYEDIDALVLALEEINLTRVG